tara:strand:- start:2707 stop:3681 length:975 start_codon:yes stop_codon:yes gene_type:complete
MSIEINLSPSPPSSPVHASLPLQIGIVILGQWKTTKIPLEYLVLLLNQKQKLFEYQLVSIDEFKENFRKYFGKESDQDDLITSMVNGSKIKYGKLKLKHLVNDVACALKREIDHKYDLFDNTQNPAFFIFITTSKHIDVNFFQDDGSNGFCENNPCRGAIIMTGHHESSFAPPTVIEFIFKFIFRISIKWKYPNFTRKMRHFGQKSCLFDFNHDICFVRYLVLHNYICGGCRNILGNTICESITNALDSKNLYGTSIERHPAKISSDLGYNLSLVKGIYKSKYEMMREKISDSFFSKLGSLIAFSSMLGIFYLSDTNDYFLLGN